MATGFHYRLQALLVLATERQAAARRTFLAAGVSLRRELGVEQALDSRRAQLGPALRVPALAADLREIELRRERLERARRDRKARVAGLRESLERERTAYEQTIRSRSGLERHRARRLETYLAGRERCEQEELDEANALLPGTQGLAAK